MNLDIEGDISELEYFPRASGDEPSKGYWVQRAELFSPREWG